MLRSALSGAVVEATAFEMRVLARLAAARAPPPHTLPISEGELLAWREQGAGLPLAPDVLGTLDALLDEQQRRCGRLAALLLPQQQLPEAMESSGTHDDYMSGGYGGGEQLLPGGDSGMGGAAEAGVPGAGPGSGFGVGVVGGGGVGVGLGGRGRVTLETLALMHEEAMTSPLGPDPELEEAAVRALAEAEAWRERLRKTLLRRNSVVKVRIRGALAA